MEPTDYATILVLAGLSGAVFGYITTSLTQRSRELRVAEVEGKVEQLLRSWYSKQSQDVRISNKEDDAAFMAQAATILQGPEDMKDKIQKVIALNPGAAMRMAKKLGIGL